MARKKIEFTEEQNFTLAALVEVNKPLEEIVKLFNEKYGTTYAYSTIFKHIKDKGFQRLDNRKYNGTWTNGVAIGEVVESKSKPLSKYKIKKLEQDTVANKEDVKRLGYDKNGTPLNYKLLKDRDGVTVEVVLKITTDDLSYTGGDCKRGSMCWWATERARFDFGDKYHPLLPGQNRGDWRGVINRFLYKEDGYLRLTDIDIIKEQQDAWERYVDAYFEKCIEESSPLPIQLENMDNHNVYMINQMNSEVFSEMLRMAPDIVYKYIPNYIYGVVVCWCVDKLIEDRRIRELDDKRVEALKNIIKMASIKTDNDDESNRITLQTIQRCLDIHPNDYDLVIKRISLSAIKKGLITYKYKDALNDIVMSLKITSIPGEYKMLDETDPLDLYSGKVSILDIMFERENNMSKFCKENGLIC